MACDVTLELLDRENLLIRSYEHDLKVDQLITNVAEICHISPVARGLFAFKQVSVLLLLSFSVYLVDCLVDDFAFCLT